MSKIKVSVKNLSLLSFFQKIKFRNEIFLRLFLHFIPYVTYTIVKLMVLTSYKIFLTLFKLFVLGSIEQLYFDFKINTLQR